jgi:hypothetical protein
MATKRGGHVAVTSTNSTAVVVGGYDGSNYLKSVEILDPASGNWYEGPAMRKRRSGAGVVLGDDGAIYAAGKDGLNLLNLNLRMERKKRREAKAIALTLLCNLTP